MTPLAEEEVAASTLSCFLYPEGVVDAEFRAALAGVGLIVAGALAHLGGKAFRLGHMGNTTEEMLISAIEKIGEALKDVGHDVSIEQAVNRFKEETASIVQ